MLRVALPLAIALSLLPLAGCRSAAAGPASAYSFVSYPLEKVRPEAMPEPGGHAALRLAGNEYRAVAFGVANPGPAGRAIVGVSVRSVPGLSMELYAQQYYRAAEPTRWFDGADRAGWWPDPLIPVPAAPDGGCDFGFPNPIEVPAGENRCFVLDLRLAPGVRAAAAVRARVSLDDGSIFEYRFELRPYGFDLPAQPSIPTSANFDEAAALRQHGLKAGSPEASALLREYRRQMLRHGLAPYYAGEGTVPYAADAQGRQRFDFSGFDAEAGPFLDGELFPDAPRPGSFWVPEAAAGADERQYYRQLQEHLRAKGWLDRSIRFLRDEPLLQDFVSIRAAGRLMREAAPDIPTMVTEPWNDRLAPVTTIFCPDIFSLGDAMPGLPFFFRDGHPIIESQLNANPRQYRAAARRGSASWLYSCNSAQLLDIPNVFIDSPANAQRAIGWLLFRYDFRGFLYWHVNAAYSIGPARPWTDQFNIHTHGDGTLFYPGRAGDWWLERETPIVSLRMKLLREGFEDYEYLKLLAAARGGSAAYELCGHGARAGTVWEKSADRLERLRDRIAQAIGR